MELSGSATVDGNTMNGSSRKRWAGVVVAAVVSLTSGVAISGNAQAAPADATGGMIATQSSTNGKAVASRAIDGNTDGNFRAGSVTHTKPKGDANPWLNVEFTTPRPLRSVAVWNRTDCCGERLDSVKIKVSTDSANACLGKASKTIDTSKIPPTNSDPVANSYMIDRSGSPRLVRSVCVQKDSPVLSIAELEFTDGPVITDGDDVIDQTLLGYHTQFNGILWAGGGNDVINSVAGNLGIDEVKKHFNHPNTDGPNEWRGVTVTVRGEPVAKYERHIHAGPGDDQINLIFAPFTGDDARRLGHHVWGEGGSDTFNFVNIENVKPGNTVVGRIDGFDFSRDSIQIEGKTIDLQNLPKGVRVVEYMLDYQNEFDTDPRPQQFLLIENSRGGRIFYGLEGVRWTPIAPGAYVERHFVLLPTVGWNELPDATVENTYGYVPSDAYANISPDQIRDWPNRPERRWESDVAENKDLNIGYDDPSKVDVINADSSADMVFAMRGDDLIAGGPSDDVIFGQQGNDRIWGGTEADTIDGGPGNDELLGQWSYDKLYGGSGDDTVDGGLGDDVLYGDDTTEQMWLLNPVVQFPTGKGGSYQRPESGGNYEIPAELQPAGKSTVVAITDDDATLSSTDVSGGRPEGAPQILTTPARQSLSGAKVSLTGSYRVRNTANGATGRMYLFAAPRPPGKDGKPKTDSEFYVFDSASKVGLGGKYTVIGGLESTAAVNYTDVAVPLAGALTEGEDGNDLLIGGTGNDRLTGGGGADVFEFDASSGDDIITDFDETVDLVHLVGVNPSELAVSGPTPGSGLAGPVLRFKGQTISFATAQKNVLGSVRFVNDGNTAVYPTATTVAPT